MKLYPTEKLHEDEDNGTMTASLESLADAVVGHRIVKAERRAVTAPDRWGGNEALVITLDNGKEVQMFEEGDCCAYTTIDKFLMSPDAVNHVILGVGTTAQYNVWHIFADFGDIMTLLVNWSCGNPFYYSYGFDIRVVDL